MEDILLAILGGGVSVAVIEAIKEALAWRRNRKAQKEDRAEDKADMKTEERIKALEVDVSDIKKMMASLVESQKNVLFNRIQYLCRRYISEGEIDFDDRRGLNALHHSYHYGLGGNGDLDALMDSVRALPLKPKN